MSDSNISLFVMNFFRSRKSKLLLISGALFILPALAVSAITPNGIFFNLQPEYYLSIIATTLLGILLVVSVFGLGNFLFRSLALARSTPGFHLLQGLAGLSIYIAVGGVLNLLQIINFITIYFLVGLGLVFFALDFADYKNLFGRFWRLVVEKGSGVDKFLVFSTLTVVAIYYVRGANSQVWNAHDDENAYIVFAEKMRQAGGLGLDPYSERRLVSALGGQSFLDSIVLFFRPVSALHLFDFGVGFLLCVLLIAGFALHHSWPIKWVSLLVIFFAISPNQSANITSTYTSIAFVIGLSFLATTFISPSTGRNFLIMGLFAGAAITLKNSLAPFIMAIVFYAMVSLYAHKKDLRNSLLGMAVFLASFLTVFVSWGVSLFLSNGTFYYPLLGKGNHGSNYGNFNYLDQVSLQTLIVEYIKNSFFSGELLAIGLVGILSSIIPFGKRMNKIERGHPWWLLLIVLLSGAAIHYATATFGTLRYMFPMLIGVSLFLVIWVGSKSIRIGAASLVVLITLSFAVNFASSGASLTNLFGSRIFINGLDPTVEQDRANTLKLQSHVPTGEVILARLGRNYLFDFKRNPIWIADYPGAASPNPGLPIFEGPETMRQYLLDQGIRYVAFRYSDLFTREVYAGRLLEAPWSWVRVEAENTFAFQENLAYLAKELGTVYDDGQQLLLYLDAKRATLD